MCALHQCITAHTVACLALLKGRALDSLLGVGVVHLAFGLPAHWIQPWSVNHCRAWLHPVCLLSATLPLATPYILVLCVLETRAEEGIMPKRVLVKSTLPFSGCKSLDLHSTILRKAVSHRGCLVEPGVSRS
jgi:hypothetical protein